MSRLVFSGITTSTIVEGDCLIFFIPSLGNTGLFSVPAPSQHPSGVRRGFFVRPRRCKALSEVLG